MPHFQLLCLSEIISANCYLFRTLLNEHLQPPMALQVNHGPPADTYLLQEGACFVLLSLVQLIQLKLIIIWMLFQNEKGILHH